MDQYADIKAHIASNWTQWSLIACLANIQQHHINNCTNRKLTARYHYYNRKVPKLTYQMHWVVIVLNFCYLTLSNLYSFNMTVARIQSLHQVMACQAPVPPETLWHILTCLQHSSQRPL